MASPYIDTAGIAAAIAAMREHRAEFYALIDRYWEPGHFNSRAKTFADLAFESAICGRVKEGAEVPKARLRVMPNSKRVKKGK